MEPPSFSTTGPQTVRAAPGSDASIVLPLPSGSPPFEFQWSRAGAKLDDRFKRSDDAGGVRLTISAARTGDSGFYTLQASNAAGKDTTRVRLEVSPDETPTGEDPPTFLRRLQDLTVKVGTRTRFLVEIVSSTECRVTWYRNERRLLEAERIALVRDGNFWCADISAVSVDDAGRWTCTAENVGGRASCSAHLNVLVPKAYKRPEFVEELRALLTEQGTVSLECKVVGVPTPVLRWFKDSREIKAGDVFALTANAEDPTSLGTYTCEAINCMGRAYSSSKVHVVGRASRESSTRPSSGGITPEPPPIFTKELEDQFVRICDPLTLSCHIVVPPWPRSVVWYNKEGKIDPSERYHVLEDGVGGYLLEVPSAEWPDEGEWKCVATSSGGRVGISTCYVSMDVPKNYRKPRFMENLQAVLTEEGLVSFECKVVGFPTPLLSWFKDGQELKPGDVYQLTGTNSLGSYCCIARNCMGQASSSAELTVEDIQNQLNEEEKLQLFSRNQAPKFLQGLKSVEAKIDEPFRFTIKVSIPPEPTVLWYRDDQPIDESSRCHHGKEERGVFYLDIQNLEFMDQAEWKCVAMNDYGHSVTSCFLKLIIPRHFKKPRFLENLQAILSDEGAVNLECKVIGVPQPVLKWYKDGEELKPGDIHRIISGQDGTCCLGTYTCEAQNCMGIAASSASLLGFEDSMKAKSKKKADEQALQRNLSLSTIHEERTSQMYDTPVGDMTLDEKGEISFSFDGKEVSVSLYETPDLTEEEALQIVEMYADQLSENVTEHNVVELPPLRFVKETSTSGNLLMEALIIDVSPEYFTSPEEDLRTEADIEDISIAEDNGAPQLSLDVEADGEDYLEKTIALLSDEKSDIPKKLGRKKSDSQKSADDYFSLSRDQSLSEEKKDEDTQILSESDLQSFASARSTGKPKSKSSKPSIEDGQESSDITKTVVLREDLQNQIMETDVSAVKHKKIRRSSRSSRRSSSGSEKSFTKIKEDVTNIKTESTVNVEKIDFNKEKVKTAINGISLSLTEVINEIQILERDIILKSEFMSTAATASNSLEMINSLITPLSEIHSITDAIREAVEYSENITSLVNTLPESLQNLRHSLTIINKCIDVESENKTLVTKTCISIIYSCGQQLHNIIRDLNTTVNNECPFIENIHKSNIDTITTDLVSIIKKSLDMVNIEENKKAEKDGNVEEVTVESKHLRDTQKAIYYLRGSLKSLLYIVEEVDILKTTSFPNIKTNEIILNDMSTPIQDLQTALEHIETLSVTESKSDLQKYNTEIIEIGMESVLKLRTSFEQLSAEANNIEDKDTLNEVLNAIKCNIKTISIQLDELERKTGKLDILNNDNKLEALQKMAQILINLENNLPMLETISSVKYHMTEFHKSLTKVLENVIESNDANKYFSLLEICDAVNRMNTSIKSIDSNSELALASINNTLRIIQTNVSISVFPPELNSTVISSIANTLICIQETINKADELSLNEISEDVKDLSLSKYEDSKVNVVIENIEQTIASINKVISHETAIDVTFKKAMENVFPILVDLKYCIASLNTTSSDKKENLSDMQSLSFSESIANSITELHQTISVLNQVICENADIKDLSQLSTDYAKTLLDIRHTLETLQHDVVSQCIDNDANFDVMNISSCIANVIENLKSCILMIQEQPIIEGTDDMSTLDDISGIKTTADILSGDEFMIATIKENENVLFADQQVLPTIGNALQTLKDYIVVLQNSDIFNVLEPVGHLELASMKSLVIGLEEIYPQIENILHPIVLESNKVQPLFVNLSNFLEIIPVLQDIQQCLTNIDINTIQVRNDVAETNPEKNNIIKETINNFKSHLNYCIGIILPAVEVVDNTVDVSTNVVSLRQSCQKLHSLILELEEPIKSDKEIKADVSRLQETVELFLETTAHQNKGHLKCAIENLYEDLVSVQIETTQFATTRPEKEKKIMQLVHDVKQEIVALQECNFVNLCDLSFLEKEEEVVEKSKDSDADNIIKPDNIITHLKELVAPCEIIYKQLLEDKKEKVDLELAKEQFTNFNETVKKLKRYHSFDNISLNGDDTDMVIKLNNIANDILGSIEEMKLTESMETICQPIKVIKDILNQILPAKKDDGKQILPKEKTETLLQHMNQYIEIIEIVEEVSAVIKLEDLKETENIVKELQKKLINIDQASEAEKVSESKVNEEQAEIVHRLHKALVSVQVQVLESLRGLGSSADESIRQQFIEVVSDLQNDLIALASTNVVSEENITTTALESNFEEQNANVVLENQGQFEEIVKDEIYVETIPLTKLNEAESESKPLQAVNTNLQLNSSKNLSTSIVEKEPISVDLILEELNSTERNQLKTEKLAAVNEILLGNLNEYISENTMEIMSKLAHPLHYEYFKKTFKIAKQLWNTMQSEIAGSETIDVTKFSTKQIELTLSLNEAISLMYPTTFEENQELENKVGKEKLQSLNNVVTNLRNTIQEIVNNIKFLPSVSDDNEFDGKQEETNIAEMVEEIPTEDTTITDSNVTENIRDSKYNITNNSSLTDVTEGLQTNRNILNAEDNNFNKDNNVTTDTEQLYEENKGLTSVSTTIQQNVSKFDTEVEKNKRLINKEELLCHIEEYFCEKTVNDMSYLLKVEDIQYSLDIAHQLYDSLSSVGTDTCNISTKQLKLALLLEKSVTSLLEPNVQEIENRKVLAGKKELLKTTNVLSNLRNDLKTLIEITLIDTNLSILDLDDLRVLITKEPFEYEIIFSNDLATVLAAETISENIADIKELEQPLSYATEIVDDSNYARKTEITSEKLHDKISTQEINILRDDLQPEDFGDDNSIIKLQNLLAEVNDIIDISCDENLEMMQNNLDEVQTIIMKMKSDIDGSMGDTISETLEDLECNVRSVQLQIIENSPQPLIKEACANLQVLVAHISEINEVEEVLKPTENKVTNDVLDECSNDITQIIELIEKVSCSENTQHLEHIISSLNQVKDSIKSLRLKFLTNADTLIMGGVEIVQNIDKIEDQIFCLEKDLESEKIVDPTTRDNIISAIHSVYGIISNMRGMISSVKEKYMYENYGKPSRYFLISIKNVTKLVTKEKTANQWKQFSQSLRKVLNHFEDIKFYINFDKTARLPGDAAFTKIILGELVSVLFREVSESVSNLDPEVSKKVDDCVNYINGKLSDIEPLTTLEVKEKIPIFKDLSVKILELTKAVKVSMQNEIIIDVEENNMISDLTPSQLTPYIENENEDNKDKKTITDDVVSTEYTQALSEKNKENEENRNVENVLATQTLPIEMSTVDEDISTSPEEEVENTSIQKHQEENKILQSDENIKMLAGMNLESESIVQTEEVSLEKDSYSLSDMNLIEENFADAVNIKEKTETNLSETVSKQEVNKENHDKVIDSDYLLDKTDMMLQKTDDEIVSEMVLIGNDDIEKQTQNYEKKPIENSTKCEKNEEHENIDTNKKGELLETKIAQENEAVLSIERKVEESVDSCRVKVNVQENNSIELLDIHEENEGQVVANVEKKEEFIKSLEESQSEDIYTGCEKHEESHKEEFKIQEQEYKETLLPGDYAAKALDISINTADVPDQYKESKICDDNEEVIATKLKEKEESVKVIETKECANTFGNEELEKEYEMHEQQQGQTISTVDSKAEELVKPFTENTDMLIENLESQAITQVEEGKICVSDKGEKLITKEKEEKKEEVEEEEEVEQFVESSSGKDNVMIIEFEEQKQQQKEVTNESKAEEPVHSLVENIATNKSNLQGTSTVEESTIHDESENQVTKYVEEIRECIKLTETKEDKEQLQNENEILIEKKSMSQKIEQVAESNISNISEKEVTLNIEEKEDFIKVLELKELEKSNSVEENQFKEKFKKQDHKSEETLSTINNILEDALTTSLKDTKVSADPSKPLEPIKIKPSEICDNSVHLVNLNVEEKEKFTKLMETIGCEESSTSKDDKFKKEFNDQEQNEKVTEKPIDISLDNRNIDMSNNSKSQEKEQARESKVCENIEKQVKEKVCEELIDTCLEHKTVNMSNKSKSQEKEQAKESKVCENIEEQVTRYIKGNEEPTEQLETKECEENNKDREDQLKKEFMTNEQQQKENVPTIESLLKESVDTSLENKDRLVDKSAPIKMEQDKENEICDINEKQVIESIKENEKSISVVETKKHEEGTTSRKEGQLKDQVQQQKETSSSIENTVNEYLENEDILQNKSVPQETEQDMENKIYDNVKEQVIEMEKFLEIPETKDKIQKELKDEEQKEEDTIRTIETTLNDCVDSYLENKNVLVDKSKPHDIEPLQDSKIQEHAGKVEPIKVQEREDYEENNAGKECQFKNKLNEEEQKQTVLTLESTIEESINTSVQNIDKSLEKNETTEIDNKYLKEEFMENLESFDEKTVTKTKKPTLNIQDDNSDFLDVEVINNVAKEQIKTEITSCQVHTIHYPENSSDSIKPEIATELQSHEILPKCDTLALQIQHEENDSTKLTIEPKQEIKVLEKVDDTQNIKVSSTVSCNNDFIKDTVSQKVVNETDIHKSMTSPESIKLKIATELQLEEIPKKCDTLDLQIQQEEKDYATLIIEPKQEIKLSEKEDGTEIVKVTATVSYNDDLIKGTVSQIEINVTDVHKSIAFPESIKLETATELQLDEIHTKCDTLDLQIQQEEKDYATLMIEPKQEIKLSEKEDGTEIVKVSSTVSYNDDLIKDTVSQKVVNVTDVHKSISFPESIKLETATELQLDEIHTKCDTSDLQIQQQEEDYATLMIEPKQEIKLSEKEDGTEIVKVTATVSYNDDLIKDTVSQKVVNVTDVHKSIAFPESIKLETASELQLDEIHTKCDTLNLQIQQQEEDYATLIIEPKNTTGKEHDTSNIKVSSTVSYNDDSIKDTVSEKKVTETNIHESITKIDLVNKDQDNLLLKHDVDTTDTNEHITRQNLIQSVDTNEMKQKENNQGIHKTDDDKHEPVNIDISAHHPLDVKSDDNTTVCSNKSQVLEPNNNDLLPMTEQDTQTKSNDFDKNKQKSPSEINNKTDKEQKNNEKEIKYGGDAKKEKGKVVKEETKQTDVEEKVKENMGRIKIQTISELEEISKDILFLENTFKMEENAEIKIVKDAFIDVLSDFSVTENINKIAFKSEDDLEGISNKLEETCSKNIETNIKCLECIDDIDQNITKNNNIEEYSERKVESETENVRNIQNNIHNIIHDGNKESISMTQKTEISKAEKVGEEIINKDSIREMNKNLDDGNSYTSKEEFDQSRESTDETATSMHSEVLKGSNLLEQIQQVKDTSNNNENSEQLQSIVQENFKEKEKPVERIQDEGKEQKQPDKKPQKEKKRSKKIQDTSKPERKNEKPEGYSQEPIEKNLQRESENTDVISSNEANSQFTKPDDVNVVFNKCNEDNHDNLEQKEQTNTIVQINKVDTKETDNEFISDKEAERERNKNDTVKLSAQLNDKEGIQTSEHKKENILMKKDEDYKESKRKQKRKSSDGGKIKSEEKEIDVKKLEEMKGYDFSKQLKDNASSIVKDIREEQIKNERPIKRMNTIVVDNIITDFESEFSRPSGYIPKPFCVDDPVPQIQICNNKTQTIYKVQSLRHESQLRYSMPPHIAQSSDRIERRSQIKENTKAASECRSTLSEKRSSSSRDVKRKPIFSTFLTDRTAVESSRVKLTCSVLTPTDPKVAWYKNGVQLENKHKFRSKFVDGLITLEILNALPSDSGEYSCSVENENGSITSSANLKVYPSFEASPIPPTFTRSIRDTYHLAENELVLECRIRGQPLPTITWHKNDQPIVSERYQAHYLADGVCRLTISNPTIEDSGKYTCKAESSVWSDEITHNVYFTGKKGPSSPNIATVEKMYFNRLGFESRRPHFTNVLSDHKVVTGGTIGLQVEIRGSPIRVEWLREGQSVTELYGNAQTYVDHDIYTLALSDVTEKESGLYTCRAYSNQGNVDMNASITVVQPNQYEGKPATIVSRPEKDVIISVGEDINISFRVHGEPKAKVFFMKGIRDLTTSQRVCKMTSDDYVKFTLKRTVVSDAGTYCIYARNAYGCDRAFVTVVIRQRASSESLISDWTYPTDDLAISSVDRNYKSVPDRIPSEPSVVDGGNNWVSLAWPKSDHQSRAPVLAYKVESWLLGKEGGARWTELGITPRNSFDAFNLKQGEEYHFRVTPRNRYGWGESVQTSVPFGIGLTGDRPEFTEILPGQLKVLVGEKAILRCSFTGKPIPEIVWMKNGHEIEEEPGRIITDINNFHSSLRIEEVKTDDEGRYSCEATNLHGRSSTYARMAVITDRQIWEADAKLKRERSAGIDGEYPPQFTMRLRDRRVQATYPVRLTCQVVGNPPPVVKWFKNEEEITIGGRYTASQDEYFYTLEIAPTTLEDGGVYEAMARNGWGAVSCRCSLVVDKGIRAYIAPEFCCGLEPLYHLCEGEELRISAIVEAYPSVGVTWYRDGVRLRPSRRAIMTLDRDGQIELALASVTGRDAGVYTCTASNEVGMASTSGKVEVVSGEYVVNKASAPPIIISSDMPYSKEPMFIRKPRSSEAREGDTVIIECEVTGDPKPDVYWLRDFLKPDYYRDSSHFKRIGAGPAYRFEIPHAKLDFTGAYSIVAKNIHGETKAIISLQILAKDPSCGDDVHNIKYGRVEVIPRFDKELTDLLCYDGDAVEFECSLSGNPDPDIRWLHYNEIVPECSYFETSYDEGTARLKIKQVTAEDEGTYTCEASNSLGKASSSACLVVYTPGEPNTLSTRLRRPPALLSAASTPRSTPRTTPARSMSRTPGPEPRRLCSPSREIAPKFYTYPFNRVAEEGDTVVFQCAVKGLPPPWATWDKDGIIITPSARITIKEKDEMFKILEIEQVTIEDVGLYRISLENDYGRAEASARLEVITQKGKFYGSTRSYSVSPRKTLPYRRRTPSFSKQD